MCDPVWYFYKRNQTFSPNMPCTLKNADLCVTCHFISPTLALIFPLIYTYCGMCVFICNFFIKPPNQTPRMHFYSLPDAPHILDGKACLIFYFQQHDIEVHRFPSYIHWFIKTVVTNLILFKTYLCVVFFSFASCLGKLREISDVLTGIRLRSLWIFMTGFPLNKMLVATTPDLCRGRLRKKETCRFMSQMHPICPLAHLEVTNLPKAVAELDFQMKSTRSTAKPFVMTCPSVSVPQNSRSADEKLAGHCACALSSGEKNKTDMSFRWTRGRGGLKGSWQGLTHTHTHMQGHIRWEHLVSSSCVFTHFEHLTMGVPPQTLSSPSRSVALFVIVIRPVFVKGSLAVCSRWWVYVCVFVKVSRLKECRDIIAAGFFVTPCKRYVLQTGPSPNLSQKLPSTGRNYTSSLL